MEPWIRESEHGIGKVLIPRTAWSNDYENLLRETGIRALRLSYSAGFRGESIDFLGDLTFLKSIEIYSFDVRDLSAINHLKQLEVVGLEVKAVNGISFATLPLRVALVRWCKDISSLLESEHLEHMNIQNYPYPDLRPLRKLSQLRHISITSRKLASLIGLESLPLVRCIDLYNCPSLVSIVEAREKESVKRIEVEACQHISRDKLIEEYA